MKYLCDSCGIRLIKRGFCKPLHAQWGKAGIPWKSTQCEMCNEIDNCSLWNVGVEEIEQSKQPRLHEKSP